MPEGAMASVFLEQAFWGSGMGGVGRYGVPVEGVRDHCGEWDVDECEPSHH